MSAEGEFTKGDVVTLQDADGRNLARGLTNYGRHEVDQIRGLKSDEILKVLGYLPYDEVIHRNNMVVFTST